MILTDWFSPGYRAGGPITSCLNLAKALSTYVEVYVLTSDRDLNEHTPYPGVTKDQWVDFPPNIKVCYLSPNRQTRSAIRMYINQEGAPIIYLNSLFSTVFTIYPLWLKWRGQIKGQIVLAPRGMLRASALQFNSLKKKVFIQCLRLIRLHKWIEFHATDKAEVKDIKKHISVDSQITLIPNYPLPVREHVRRVKGGPSCFLFLGRIHPIKGLLETLEYLQEITEPMKLSIIGSKEIEDYWQKCQSSIQALPKHIKVNILGELPPSKIRIVQKDHHFLILPTKGENFGHAIFESMAMGLPVIISDQTPWRDLQAAGIGWDISLDHADQFINAINHAIQMPQTEYQVMSRKAWEYARNFIETNNLRHRYLKMFFGLK